MSVRWHFIIAFQGFFNIQTAVLVFDL